MRTRTLLLTATFVAAVLTNARGQSAPAAVEPAAPAAATAIKDTEPVRAPVTAKGKDATGKDTLSVDFPDTDIREILRNVADLFELNLVMPDTLQGKASIKLRDVTWRQIFEVVLKQVGYTFVEKDNIVKIVSLNDLQNEPFSTKTFAFENVSSSRILPLISGMLTPKKDAVVNGTTTSPAQPGGTIVNSELANELIITDQSTVLARIGEMIKRLDTEPRQVVIETKFVEISKDDAQNREIALAYKNLNTGLDVRTGVGIGASSNMAIPFATNSGQLMGGSPTAVFGQNEFNAFLNILNSATNVRLVTNPTIVAINGSKSDIKIGRELQLVTVQTTPGAAGSQPQITASAGEVKFVGISLEVTPQITGNKLIALKVKPVKSSVFAERTIGGNTFFDIDKREGELNIILRDGQTAAIGGLVDSTTRKGTTKVPLLGDIPLLGNLFKTTKDIKAETNLIIFITATVLEPSKMKYDNVISKDQIHDLDVTQRDILGRNYSKSDEESALQEQVGAMRQRKQDAANMERLNVEAIESAKKKSN